MQLIARTEGGGGGGDGGGGLLASSNASQQKSFIPNTIPGINSSKVELVARGGCGTDYSSQNALR